ncbi:MAG: hypothetical protein JWO75_6037 [Actinomycetia bacterium]|nr:hypothetical protein [Actinomycetes bacterium]
MATYRDVTALTQDSVRLREMVAKLANDLEKQLGARTDPLAGALLSHARSMCPAVDQFVLHLDSVKALIKALEGSGGSPEPSDVVEQ